MTMVWDARKNQTRLSAFADDVAKTNLTAILAKFDKNERV